MELVLGLHPHSAERLLGPVIILSPTQRLRFFVYSDLSSLECYNIITTVITETPFLKLLQRTFGIVLFSQTLPFLIGILITASNRVSYSRSRLHRKGEAVTGLTFLWLLFT